MEAGQDGRLPGRNGDAGDNCSEEEKKVALMRTYVEGQDPAAKVIIRFVDLMLIFLEY